MHRVEPTSLQGAFWPLLLCNGSIHTINKCVTKQNTTHCPIQCGLISPKQNILTFLDLCFSLIYQTLLCPSVPNPSTWPILMDLEYLPVFSFLSLLYWVKLTQTFPTVINASLCEWEARWAHGLCVAIVSCASPEMAGCARRPSHLRRGLLRDQSCSCSGCYLRNFLLLNVLWR